MTLRDAIEQLQALTPPSALDAQVKVATKKDEADWIGVQYAEGVVTIEVDDLSGRYEEGYEDGREEGLKEGRNEER